MNTLTINQCKEIWIVGAVQRLFSLGYLSGNMPFWIDSQGIDDFLEIDEHRMFLFPDESVITDIFEHLMSKVDHNLNPENFETVVDILIAYKNDRENLVKHALCHSLR